VLIFTMLAAILALQLIIGRRKLRRADRIEAH
jgi:iron(III) transport system permease protein